MARAEYSQSKSVAMVLYRNQSAVSRLPPVGVLWTWPDAVEAVGQSTLQRLETAGLVERVTGDWWSATSELAGHMRSNHGRELEGAPGVGQEVFEVPGRPGASLAGGRDSTAMRVTSGRQTTLVGRDADKRLLVGSDNRKWSAQQTQDPAEADGQMRLDQIREWLPTRHASG